MAQNIQPRIIEAIESEITMARKHQEHFHSVYEAYGVLCKEAHELLGAISGPRVYRSRSEARKQMLSVAVVAIKALQSPAFQLQEGE